MVELLEKGNVVLQTIPLLSLRDMRTIRGSYMEVTARSFYEGTNRGDYVKVTLTDEEDIPDGMQKLRAVYPNLMRLEYDNTRTRENRETDGSVERPEEKSELELFEEFYEIQNNRPMSEEQRRFAMRLVGELRIQE